MTRRLDIQKRREWEQRFARYRAGGLTVGRFCANERVSVNTFYYWARRVGSQLDRPRTDPADEASAGRPRRVRQAAAADLAGFHLGGRTALRTWPRPRTPPWYAFA